MKREGAELSPDMSITTSAFFASTYTHFVTFTDGCVPCNTNLAVPANVKLPLITTTPALDGICKSVFSNFIDPLCVHFPSMHSKLAPVGAVLGHADALGTGATFKPSPVATSSSIAILSDVSDALANENIINTTNTAISDRDRPETPPESKRLIFLPLFFL